MGYRELSERKNWQTKAGKKAEAAEIKFFNVFLRYFKDSDTYRIRIHPNDFQHIYEDVKLEKTISETIFTPLNPYCHGIKPDFAIDNIKTGKTLYGDCKRQDGWVENKTPSAGRGNVHERACKYFTPGLLTIMRERSHLSKDVLPFWIVFQGDITRDPKRVREIHFWFNEYKKHFYLWQDTSNETGIIEHFNILKNLLD